MENQTVIKKYAQLEQFKEQAKWLESIQTAHEIETFLLDMPESQQILDCYLELFHLYYIIGDLPKAFNYFALTEPLLLQFGKWSQYTKFMQIVVETTFFYVRKDEIEQFVDQLIPMAFEQEQFEVLSHCFLTQSYIHLADQSIELAIQEAKMAYFYAQFVEEEKQAFLLCNAQLQLVLALIEKVAIDKAYFYMEQFSWSVECCQNESEHFLVKLVNSMIDLLNHKFDQTFATLEDVLNSLMTSNEIMYSTILIRQLQLVLKKVEYALDEDRFAKLNDLCEKIMSRFKMKKSEFMSEFITFSEGLIDKREPKFEQFVNFFHLGQKLFDEVMITNDELFCKVMKLNYHNLSDMDQELFKNSLFEPKLFEENNKVIISQFSPELLVVISILPVENKTNRIPLEEYNGETSTHFIFDPKTNEFANFHQLFNYVFFNQLLKLDLDPFKQSLV